MKVSILPPIDEFADWLKGLPEGAVVGKVGVPSDCPLARWPDLSRSYRNGIVVTKSHAYLCGKEYPLDRWAEQFVSEIDKSGTMNDDVTREQALTALMRIGYHAKGFVWVKQAVGAGRIVSGYAPTEKGQPSLQLHVDGWPSTAYLSWDELGRDYPELVALWNPLVDGPE